MSTVLDIRAQLRAFGARDGDVVILDQASPVERVRYLDLVRPVGDGPTGLCAIVEASRRPILYVVDASRIAVSDETLAQLRRSLAFRAGADHVALLGPGRITLYPVAPAREVVPVVLSGTDAAALACIPSLAAFADPRSTAGRKSMSAAVHDLLIDLLQSTTRTLIDAGLDHLDALSLVGRALFLRFLGDREIVTDDDARKICGAPLAGCFSTAQASFRTSGWLDATFNGDFLLLPKKGSEAWFRRVDPRVFEALGEILHRTDLDGRAFLDWGGWRSIRFERVPVGLLSQVYEHHAHMFDADSARRGSMLYTPRHVAEYMVDEVFVALGERAAQARVLDPAAGGGVFLVEAFRRIAAAHWSAGARPDTRRLREILYGQIRGFDISEPALRLCTIGLYLTAIELDPDPRPLTKLKFDAPLLGGVLAHVHARGRRLDYLGSLSREAVSAAHDGQYDVVIGNPPWNAWKSDAAGQIQEVVDTIRPIVAGRLDAAAAARYTMVDNAPDLPFVWRAMQWARPGGQIAFALHARWLFKQSPPGRRSREELLQALAVTGIVNGAALRTAKFWPTISAPFCLLFASNTRPSPDAAFWFVSPELERRLHAHARWRIDAGSSRPVRASEVASQPNLLKMLFRGTELDVQVVRRIEQLGLEALIDHWDRGDGRGHEGQGFKVGGSNTTRKKQPASELFGMRQLKGTRPARRLLDGLPLTRIPRGFQCQHPRRRAIYEAPLVVVAESPSRSVDKPNAYLALRDDVAYSQSFHGFSCAWHPEGELLARYLFLIFSSSLPTYRALLTSGKLGVERDIFEGADMLQFPFVPLEALAAEARASIVPLSDELIRDASRTSPRVESWVGGLYGLDEGDIQVIQDTFAVGAPFSEAKNLAERRPASRTIEAYVAALAATIRPFLTRHGRDLSIQIVRQDAAEPWVVFQLDTFGASKRAPGPDSGLQALFDVVQEADVLAASRVVVVRPPSRLIVASVAQGRYFTRTRARLLGLDLVHGHADTLLGA